MCQLYRTCKLRGLQAKQRSAAWQVDTAELLQTFDMVCKAVIVCLQVNLKGISY